MNRPSNIFWHHPSISRKDRERKNRHVGSIIWFTGLSGSGKSTLAHAVELELYNLGYHTAVLDGDNVRHGLCGDLGFSEQDRMENIRRIGQVSRLFVDAGVIVLTAFISPYRIDRQRVRMMVEQENDFIEVFCNCQLEICEQRDVKGLYQRARKGEIKEFTGISSPYEAPQNAELTVNTGELSVEESVLEVLGCLEFRGILSLAGRKDEPSFG